MASFGFCRAGRSNDIVKTTDRLSTHLPNASNSEPIGRCREVVAGADFSLRSANIRHKEAKADRIRPIRYPDAADI